MALLLDVLFCSLPNGIPQQILTIPLLINPSPGLSCPVYATHFLNENYSYKLLTHYSVLALAQFHMTGGKTHNHMDWVSVNMCMFFSISWLSSYTLLITYSLIIENHDFTSFLLQSVTQYFLLHSSSSDALALYFTEKIGSSSIDSYHVNTPICKNSYKHFLYSQLSIILSQTHSFIWALDSIPSNHITIYHTPL